MISILSLYNVYAKNTMDIAWADVTNCWFVRSNFQYTKDE